jgi:hypothetical protein
MSANDLPVAFTACEDDVDDLLSPLLQGPVSTVHTPVPPAGPIHGVIVGELLALADDGTVPLVRFEGQPGDGALRARSTVDLHGPHIGQAVVLMFEGGDPARPIVMGVVRGAAGWPLPSPPAEVEVDADGQRMVISAKEQMVLRCGKASITLTKAGKVLIEGSYVLSRSTGVNRIKGGSVQLN